MEESPLKRILAAFDYFVIIPDFLDPLMLLFNLLCDVFLEFLFAYSKTSRIGRGQVNQSQASQTQIEKKTAQSEGTDRPVPFTKPHPTIIVKNPRITRIIRQPCAFSPQSDS